MTRILLLALLCLLPSLCMAATPKERLFVFERSKNKNYICYDVHTSGDVLDKDEPIHAYWIEAETDGKRSELSFFQKKMAFGYKVISRGSNDVTISLKAYDKLLIHVYKKGNKWIAAAKWNGKDIIISRMFAQLHSPNSLVVDYVDIQGKLLSTGEPVSERIHRQ